MTTKAIALGFLCGIGLCQDPARAEDAPETAGYLRDRGPGVATSIPGIYLNANAWLGFASYQHLDNRGFQYSPDEFGFADDNDYLGEYESSNGLIFAGYGIGNSLGLGLKVSSGTIKLTKASDDPSAMPAQMKESGISAIAPELTWRFMTENARRPELYTFVSVEIPQNRDRNLIGTRDWVVLPGIGLNRGFSWATLSARMNYEYDAASASTIDFGKWSIEGQRRFSDAWWVSAGLEGQVGGANNFDEAWQNTFVQWRPGPRMTVRFGSRIGLTQQTKGWAGELGIVVQ